MYVNYVHLCFCECGELCAWSRTCKLCVEFSMLCGQWFAKRRRRAWSIHKENSKLYFEFSRNNDFSLPFNVSELKILTFFPGELFIHFFSFINNPSTLKKFLNLVSELKILMFFSTGNYLLISFHLSTIQATNPLLCLLALSSWTVKFVGVFVNLVNRANGLKRVNCCRESERLMIIERKFVGKLTHMIPNCSISKNNDVV